MTKNVLVTKRKETMEVILNRPHKLNVLNDEVLAELKTALQQAEQNSGIEMVFLSGIGPKGFCAGGDVVSIVNYQGNLPKTHFFKAEYEVDFMVHRFQKPIIGLCHGITMGGGVGLTNGCRLKIFDPKTLFAMPEISIGLFPDVGSSYFLNRLEKKWCLFLAMTGARLNASLSLALGLCDFVIEKKYWAQLKEYSSFDELAQRCRELHRGDRISLDQFHDLDTICDMTCAEDFDKWARNYLDQGDAHEWIKSSLQTYFKGSPLSAKIIWEYFSWGREKNLEECFKKDYELCCLMLEHSDFREGVRALLIDKDKKPSWMFKDLDSISDDIWSKYQELLE